MMYGDPRDFQSSPSLRTPPHNYGAEKALIGAILANNNAYDRVSDFLRGGHFADPVNGRIYDAMVRLIERNQIADPITLKNMFENDGTLADVGGIRYLADLAASMVSIINVGDYGRIIRNLSVKRNLIMVGEEIVNLAYDPASDSAPDDQIGEAEARLFELTVGDESERTPELAWDETEEVMTRAMTSDNGLIGLTTGLKELDRKTCGLCSPDLIILAGRPSMGKTALALAIADKLAVAYRADKNQEGASVVTAGAAVAFYSLEMGDVQLNQRRVARNSRVSLEHIRRGKYEVDADRIAAFRALKGLRNAPLFIRELKSPTPAALRSDLRRLIRKKGVRFAVVDYIQLMDCGERVSSRVEAVSIITRKLKLLAKELGIPIMALSQLSRAVEQRDDKRPQLSDLRESGSIEQDGDLIMFVYCEAYYLEREKPQPRGGETRSAFEERLADWHEKYDAIRHVMEIILAKQRQGPIGTVRAFFDGATQSIDDLDDRHTQQEMM